MENSANQAGSSNQPVSSADNTAAEQSGINLSRTTLTWTKADSPSGFVLRYAIPMRKALTRLLGSESEADEALRLFLGHLVSSGFGDHNHGPLRNFLVMGLRSVAKAQHERSHPDGGQPLKLETFKPDSPDWLKTWRSEILHRSWRALERIEHKTPDPPLFSVLHAATADTSATYEMLSVRLAAEANVTASAEQIQATIPIARETFAQLVADEIAQTLDNPTDQDVRSEIEKLALSGLIDSAAASGQ